MPNTTHRKVILIVMDGWGVGPRDSSNPINSANLPNIQWIKSNFPIASLQASGLLVGLPWKEEGNSEIGHLTISAGRTVYQMAVKIQLAIENGSFLENPALVSAMEKAKLPGSSLAIAGLVGNGITHSSFKHLQALIKMAEQAGVQNIKLHLFTDGRDSPPRVCMDVINKLPKDKIGSICGRFYGMDRDNHMDRTEAAFKAMTGAIPPVKKTIDEYINESYAGNITDEFIRPAVFNPDLAIKPNDSLIFFNFRTDRMKQICRTFIEKMPGVNITTFTNYDPSFSIPYAFPFETVPNCLGELVSNAGLSQLRIAESEKNAHVTYFFNGERETPFPKEFRIILPSKNIADHSKFPEMQAKEITDRVVDSITEGFYQFILINFANADMVAHSGNFDATIKAVQTIDECLGKIVKVALEKGFSVIVTSDHGNAECLLDTRTGEKDTKHNPNPVPFWVIDSRLYRPKSEEEIIETEKSTIGTLCDVAPTILQLMGLPKPPEMTGQSLFPFIT